MKKRLDNLLTRLYEQQWELQKRISVLNLACSREKEEQVRPKFSLFKKKEENVTSEKESASAKLEEANQELICIREAIARYEKEAVDLKEVEEDFVRVMEEKKKILLDTSSENARKIEKIEESIAQGLKEESIIKTTLANAESCRLFANAAMNDFKNYAGSDGDESSRNAYFFDTTGSGYLDEAKQNVDSLSTRMKQLNRDLQAIEGDFEYLELRFEIDSCCKEYFSHSLTDWSGVDDIQLQERTLRVRNAVNGMILKLEELLRQVAANLEENKTELNRCVLLSPLKRAE